MSRPDVLEKNFAAFTILKAHRDFPKFMPTKRSHELVKRGIEMAAYGVPSVKERTDFLDGILIKDRLSFEVVSTPLQQLVEENERLKEENAELKSLLRNHMPHIQLFRTAAMIFALCAVSFLGWLWLNIELVHPVFALLGIPASIGFMIMARIAGRLKENREETKTPQIEGVLDELRLMKIAIPESAAVKDYLLRYPDIGRVLPSLCKITSKRFEMPTQLSLEVYGDSEIDDEDLTLYVRQEDYDDQIMDIIEEIRTEYYKLLTGKSGWLHLTTDFRPPKSRR